MKAAGLLLAILSLRSVAFSDIVTPYSYEERENLERLLIQQLPKSREEEIFDIALAFDTLNSSALSSNRTFLCQLAIKALKNDGSICPVGLNAAAFLGCELSTETHSRLPNIVVQQVQVLNDTSLKSICCASSTLLLLKKSYDQTIPSSLDVNVLAKRIIALQRQDGTFGEDGNDASVVSDSAFAVQALSNLARLDKDRFPSKAARAVLDKRDGILSLLADAFAEDPSIQALSMALQVSHSQNPATAIPSARPPRFTPIVARPAPPFSRRPPPMASSGGTPPADRGRRPEDVSLRRGPCRVLRRADRARGESPPDLPSGPAPLWPGSPLARALP